MRRVPPSLKHHGQVLRLGLPPLLIPPPTPLPPPTVPRGMPCLLTTHARDSKVTESHLPRVATSPELPHTDQLWLGGTPVV